MLSGEGLLVHNRLEVRYARYKGGTTVFEVGPALVVYASVSRSIYGYVTLLYPVLYFRMHLILCRARVIDRSRNGAGVLTYQAEKYYTDSPCGRITLAWKLTRERMKKRRHHSRQVGQSSCSIEQVYRAGLPRYCTCLSRGRAAFPSEEVDLTCARTSDTRGQPQHTQHMF